jgi:hypothetical protein
LAPGNWALAPDAINLERVPIAWNHAIEKDSLQINELEHVLVGKPLHTFPGHALDDWAMEMETDAKQCRYFLSYSGVKLPLNLVSPLAATELENRNTYFRAVFDGANRLVSCQKIVYGEIELAHYYEYADSGLLSRARISMGDDDETELLFDENGSPIR